MNTKYLVLALGLCVASTSGYADDWKLDHSYLIHAATVSRIPQKSSAPALIKGSIWIGGALGFGGAGLGVAMINACMTP